MPLSLSSAIPVHGLCSPSTWNFGRRSVDLYLCVKSTCPLYNQRAAILTLAAMTPLWTADLVQ